MLSTSRTSSARSSRGACHEALHAAQRESLRSGLVHSAPPVPPAGSRTKRKRTSEPGCVALSHSSGPASRPGPSTRSLGSSAVGSTAARRGRRAACEQPQLAGPLRGRIAAREHQQLAALRPSSSAAARLTLLASRPACAAARSPPCARPRSQNTPAKGRCTTRDGRHAERQSRADVAVEVERDRAPGQLAARLEARQPRHLAAPSLPSALASSVEQPRTRPDTRPRTSRARRQRDAVQPRPLGRLGAQRKRPQHQLAGPRRAARALRGLAHRLDAAWPWRENFSARGPRARALAGARTARARAALRKRGQRRPERQPAHVDRARAQPARGGARCGCFGAAPWLSASARSRERHGAHQVVRSASSIAPSPASRPSLTDNDSPWPPP